MVQDARAGSSLAHTAPTPRPLVTRRAKLSELHADPANARKHDERNLAAIADSLKTFGQVEPLVVQKSTGRVIGGNGRLEVLRKSGATECDIVEVDVNDTQAAALGIALNRTAELAEWDDEALAGILKSLPLDAVTGFSPEEMDALYEELNPPEVSEDEVPAPLAHAVSQKGDLWLMGGHRLLCGDSTDLKDVLHVMDGHKAALVGTDPPYLVDYTGQRVGDSGKDWSATYHEIDIPDADKFFRSLFTNVLKVIAPHAAIYCWHAHKRQHEIALIWRDLGILDHQQVIWVKPSSVFGSVFYHFRHEPCMMGWVKGSKPAHDGKHECDSVWEVDWEGKSRVVGNEHPCLHPEALVLTEAGYRPIQTIQIGDRVLTADGTFHDVEHVSSHPYRSPDLIQVTAKGGNVPILASDNHPFLVWRPNRVGGALQGGAVEWVRADELRVGDYTMTPVLAEHEVDPLPERDTEYWFLFGLYLAQGSLQRAGHGDHRYPSFTLHKKRQDLVRRVRERWDSVGEYDASEYGAPSQGLTVMAFDPQCGEEFERLGGRGARSKRLDPLVLRLPAVKRRAVLEGWLNGDGCRVHNRDYWQGKTVSPDLAAHLALLGQSVGYTVSVFRYEPPEELPSIGGRQFKSASPEYHLYFYQRDRAGARNARTTHLDHEGRTYALRYIKKIERVPYTGDVWNLSVSGCPTFQTAVGMSHNTQKPLELFARPMRKHTKVNDICFEPFSGSGSQIIAAEQMKRRCFAIELEPVFVDVAVRRWQMATGKSATLDGDGRTWEEIKAERELTTEKTPAEAGVEEEG